MKITGSPWPELFYEHGIHAVGVDVIAQHAGVTKKTLYDRFGSKERLVVEYLAERDRRWQHFLQRRLAHAGPAPREQVAAVFEAAEAWARRWGRKGCAMVNAHAEISDPGHPAHPVIVGQKHRMLELFTELAAAAGVAEPRIVGRHIMLLHEGAVVAAGMNTIGDVFTCAAAAALGFLR
ncbi:TetR/AcrR family transcriptional regulator [Amycolatopsis pigmentata]|uniref:TetR/AcrR family transcriptional regulator n=1 Tax=Amycolatopsis pigmentata TaxID=450801 RepID=A0ABW5FJB0_9PSEU